MAPPKRIQVVSKAAAILKLFPGVDSLSLAEIAKGLNANASSLYHVVQTLVDEGFLTQELLSRRYRLGPALLTLVPPHAQTASILAAAEKPLYDCSQSAGFDVWLAQLELDRVYYIARVDGASPLKVHMPLLQLQPAHSVAAGRVLLAGQSRERARETLALHTLRRMTPHTCTDLNAVLDIIDRARVQGWAETEEEHIEGASDLAVPVYGFNDMVIAAISIGAPSHVFGPHERRGVLPHLLLAAGEIRTRLIGEPDGGAPNHGD